MLYLRMVSMKKCMGGIRLFQRSQDMPLRLHIIVRVTGTVIPYLLPAMGSMLLMNCGCYSEAMD